MYILFVQTMVSLFQLNSLQNPIPANLLKKLNKTLNELLRHVPSNSESYDCSRLLVHEAVIARGLVVLKQVYFIVFKQNYF